MEKEEETMGYEMVSLAIHHSSFHMDEEIVRWQSVLQPRADLVKAVMATLHRNLQMYVLRAVNMLEVGNHMFPGLVSSFIAAASLTFIPTSYVNNPVSTVVPMPTSVHIFEFNKAVQELQYSTQKTSFYKGAAAKVAVSDFEGVPLSSVEEKWQPAQLPTYVSAVVYCGGARDNIVTLVMKKMKECKSTVDLVSLWINDDDAVIHRVQDVIHSAQYGRPVVLIWALEQQHVLTAAACIQSAQMNNNVCSAISGYTMLVLPIFFCEHEHVEGFVLVAVPPERQV